MADDVKSTTGGEPQEKVESKEQGGFESFEAFLEKQPDEVKALYEGHTSSLKNALTNERASNKELAKQLKALAEKAEKGSELEKQLSEYVSKAEQAERRAGFAESAIQPEIGCTNVKAAFLIAQADELFKRDGSPDWGAIKAAAPELFKKPGQAAGNAGTGTERGTPKEDMNTFIRRAAGRT